MAGSVRKRVRDGRTTWLADYFDQHGKRHNKTFGTQKAAKEWLAQTVVDIKEGTHTPTSNITVAEAGQQWIAQGERDGLERSTLDGYLRQLRLHIVPHIGRVKLAELSPAHVQHLRDRLHKARVSADLASRVVVSLGALLACAMEYGRVARNVVRDAARQRSTRRRRLEARHTRRLEVGVDIPTLDEIRAILSAAEGRWRPLIVTAIFTGLRASELRGLTWEDVDLKAETLTVRQRADRWGIIGSPKSDAGKRSIPLAALAVNTLKEWKLSCPKGEKNLVFPNNRGEIESLNTMLRQGLAPLQRKLGIIGASKRQPKYGIHAFRHAAASLLIAEGWDAKRVQTLMGHSSIQMTFDIYGHLMKSPNDDREAMRRLQARLIG
jgi:integrase